MARRSIGAARETSDTGRWKYTVRLSRSTEHRQRTFSGEMARHKDRSRHALVNEEWQALETMQQQLEESSAQFSELSVINISVDESNILAISIEDLQAKQKKVYSVELMSNWESRSNRTRWLLMANYAFSIAPQHSFGITVAQVRKWGWYATFMTNGRFIKADRTYSNDNTSSSGGDHYLWNGEKSTTRWSATLGGMLALKDFGYVYAGAGNRHYRWLRECI